MANALILGSNSIGGFRHCRNGKINHFHIGRTSNAVCVWIPLVVTDFDVLILGNQPNLVGALARELPTLPALICRRSTQQLTTPGIVVGTFVLGDPPCTSRRARDRRVSNVNTCWHSRLHWWNQIGPTCRAHFLELWPQKWWVPHLENNLQPSNRTLLPNALQTPPLVATPPRPSMQHICCDWPLFLSNDVSTNNGSDQRLIV